MTGYAIEHGMPVVEQPLREPEMQVQPSPIIVAMFYDRAARAQLFQRFVIPRAIPQPVYPQPNNGRILPAEYYGEQGEQ